MPCRHLSSRPDLLQRIAFLSVLLAPGRAAAKGIAGDFSSRLGPPLRSAAEAASPQYDPVSGVELSLDAELYRSSSQGPDTELVPLTPELSEIDRVIDMATRTYGWMPIIPQFAANRSMAWQQWKGTILEKAWPAAVLTMTVQAVMIAWIRAADPLLQGLSAPDASHRLIAPLLALSTGWNYILTLATFVTTFFVGHSHTFWRGSYKLARVVQGRINDLGLLCAAHAQRGPDGRLTTEAAVLLQDVTRELRLAHVLFWSDVCYRRSVDLASVRVLLSDDGLKRMLARGMITPLEYNALLAAEAPPSRWYLVVLEWLMTRIVCARRAGLLKGGAGFEQVSLEKVCELRGAMMGIPDELAARMPLAYVHFTHFLVDTLLVLAPLSLYPKLGVFSILITGIITLFFRGLLELSKSFLDPFGNRRVSSSGLSAELGVDVLLGESNAGSLLWPKGAVRMPFATSNMA